jgi:hypothetical protein
MLREARRERVLVSRARQLLGHSRARGARQVVM